MYNLVKLFGLIIRQFCLPNPFEAMWPEQSYVLNWVCGLFLLPVAYVITGLWYRRGDGAAFGCVLFNVVYIALTLLLWGLLEVVVIVTNNLLLTTILLGSLIVLVTVGVLIVRFIWKRRDVALRN